MATGRVPTTANSPLTAKGDLFGYSTTQARVPVGNDGETLVADSSASTGLRWQGNYAAGKNKFINGDLYVNQRAFTTTSVTFPTGYSDYGVDRWRTVASGTTGTATMTKNVFTPGTAPVAGYEGKNYFTIQTSGQSGIDALTLFRQSIEDVRTTAGNTYTISFWAKAASGTPSIAVSVSQLFGTGGSPSANAEAPAGKVAITTSWARYSITYAIPSISGKTLGTDENSSTRIQFFLSAGSNYNTNASSLGVQNNTFDLWGFQIEAGSVATAFQTATGTLAGELAACRRYYWRSKSDGAMLCNVSCFTSTSAYGIIQFQTAMRTVPTLEQGSGTNYFSLLSNGVSDSFDSIAGITDASIDTARVDITSGISVTAGDSGWVRIANANAYVAFSAEL